MFMLTIRFVLFCYPGSNILTDDLRNDQVLKEKMMVSYARSTLLFPALCTFYYMNLF